MTNNDSKAESSTPNTRRRFTNGNSLSAEQHLDQNAKEAEAKLAARRRARAEARAARLKIVESQSGDDYDGDRPKNRDVRAASLASVSSRRSSDADSEFAEMTRENLEEDLRKAMVTTHQLESEKQALSYLLETYRDDLEELKETHQLVKKKLQEKTRASDLMQRDYNCLQVDKAYLEHSLNERDRLITEHGLVLVGEEEGNLALVSKDMAELLGSSGEGTLEKKLQILAEEKQALEDEATRLREELSEERNKVSRLESVRNCGSGKDTQHLLDAHRDVSKNLSDYKYKLKRAEQDVTALSSQVSRLETQLKHYKGQAEETERAEEELKAEKRKLLRELREAQARIDELETSNSHLQKRMDKLKTARSQILSQAARDSSPPP